ncbi:MAG: aminotransferase class V-fold PLP-dependent enzyme [Planctomycetes bacterium]|nr:aminotransferase class V-fold PLP-dependent enzyme [Planctomycetota bacterium]MCB9884444.1 aminotransferase class V-fold PLP-dependent enzyme [Planctomycetota bacterium]
MSPTAADGAFCDFNAGAPALPEVLECFVAVERECPANPASAHGPGRRARAVLEDARARIAAALELAGDDVLFTSGGTEAANLAVLGLGDPSLPVLLSATEHPAVFEPAQRRGTVAWELDRGGRALVTPPAAAVGLIALVHGQSELGTLQPIAAAAALAGEQRVPLLVDAAQTLGRVALDEPLRAGATVILSPHKCGGMRGHGVLAGRGLATRLQPLLRGGGQELGLRPGTQSPALAAANALAIERAVRDRAARAATMADNRSAFLRGLQQSGVAHVVLTPLDDSLPNTVMVLFSDLEGRSLLPTLDLHGVFASHGSACSSGAPTPPRVLRAIGLSDRDARAAVRFSFDWHARGETLTTAAARCGVVLASRQKNS